MDDHIDSKASETRLKAFLARYIEQKNKKPPLKPQEAAALACLKFSRKTLNQGQIGALIVGKPGKLSQSPSNEGSSNTRMGHVMNSLADRGLVIEDPRRKRRHSENCYQLTQKGLDALAAFDKRVLETPAEVHEVLLKDPNLHYAEMIRVADPLIEKVFG